MGPKQSSKKMIKKNPPQQLLPPREVRIYNLNDITVQVNEKDFKAVVQKLTGNGKPPTVDHHDEFEINAIQAPTAILSPEPSYRPPISPDFFYPAPFTTYPQPQPQGVYDGGRVMTDEQLSVLLLQIGIYNALPDYSDFFYQQPQGVYDDGRVMTDEQIRLLLLQIAIYNSLPDYSFFYPAPFTTYPYPQPQGVYDDGRVMTDEQIRVLDQQIAFYNSLPDYIALWTSIVQDQIGAYIQ